MYRPFLLTLVLIAVQATTAGAADKPKDRLAPGEKLKEGERLVCEKGLFTLYMQPGGNLVLYLGEEPNWTPIWSTGTKIDKPELEMQAADGNLVVYAHESGGRVPKWFTNTAGHPGAYLVCQHDGNLVVRNDAGQVFWSSDSAATAKLAAAKIEERIAEDKRKKDDLKRRVEAWRSELEEEADELAKRGDAMEARLKEREATYKRRVEAGGLDAGTLKEIEKLKKEIPRIWKELAELEDAIEAGPPKSVLADRPPAKDKPATPATSSTAGTSTSPGTGPTGGGRVSGSAPSALKTVHVSGYTKSNGTYVAPHTRSSPKR